jgi:antitoxin PrlF
MALARSRLTAQGQVSVPADIRKKLGVGPGAFLEWEEEGGRVVVRRAGRYSSEEIHLAVFRKAPEAKSLNDLKEGVRRYIQARHARR